MEDPRRAPDSGSAPRPGADTTAAGAFAPPPGHRTILRFVAVLVLLTCGVAGVLLLFTDVAVGYAVLCLAVAALAAGALSAQRRSGR